VERGLFTGLESGLQTSGCVAETLVLNPEKGMRRIFVLSARADDGGQMLCVPAAPNVPCGLVRGLLGGGADGGYTTAISQG